jgi:hypothetical protein
MTLPLTPVGLSLQRLLLALPLPQPPALDQRKGISRAHGGGER